MSDNKPIKDRINSLIDLTNRTLDSKVTESGTIPRHRVSKELFAELRAAGLSFILKLVGNQHPFYKEFDEQVKSPALSDTEKAKGIFKSIKAEIDSGFFSVE